MPRADHTMIQKTKREAFDLYLAEEITRILNERFKHGNGQKSLQFGVKSALEIVEMFRQNGWRPKSEGQPFPKYHEFLQVVKQRGVLLDK